MAAKKGRHDVTSLSLSPATEQHAFQIRVPPTVLQQLRVANAKGHPCQFMVPDKSGTGAALQIDSRRIPLVARGAQNTEVICQRPAGRSASIRVTHKVAVDPTAAEPASNLQGKGPKTGTATAPPRPAHPRGTNPSSGDPTALEKALVRTTAPPRPPVVLKKRDTPNVAPPPACVQRVDALQPTHRRSQGTAAHSTPATPEEVAGALAAGSHPMLLAALLISGPLKKNVLIHRIKEACRAAGITTPKAELTTALRQVAEFRSPGVYVLLPAAREEFEATRGRLSLPTSCIAGQSTHSRQRQAEEGPDARTSRNGAVNGRKSGALELSGIPNGTDGGVDRSREGPHNQTSKLEKQGRTSAVCVSLKGVTGLEGNSGIDRRSESPSCQSNGTRCDIDGASPGSATGQQPPRKKARQATTEGPADSKAVATRTGPPGDDSSWYAQHVSRRPVLLTAVSDAEHFEEVSVEYKTKYKVYHRLCQEIQASRRLVASMAAKQSCHSATKEERRRAADELEWFWRGRKQRVREMESALVCLHKELRALKTAAETFASAYNPPR